MTVLKWGLMLASGAVVLCASAVASVLIAAGRDYAEDDDWQGIT